MKTKYDVGDVLTIKVRVQRIHIGYEGTIAYELASVKETSPYGCVIELTERELDESNTNNWYA